MEKFELDKQKTRLVNFFKEYSYVPQSWADATHFFNGVLGLMPHTSFTKYIAVKNEVVDVDIDDAYPFGAFLPEVWKQLNKSEKLNAINMVKNYFVDRDLLQVQKIEISCIPNSLGLTAEAGFQIGKSGKNAVMYVDEKYILTEMDNDGLKLLGILIHEFTHASQHMTHDNLNRKNIDSFDDFAKTVITSKDLDSYLNTISAQFVLKNKGDVEFSEDEIEILNDMLRSDNNEFASIKHLLYTALPSEVGAENRATRMYKKIGKDMYKKYGTFIRVMYEPNYKKYGKLMQEKAGYLFKDEDYEELGKIDILLCCYQTMPYAVKHLIDLYTNKKLTSKVDNSLVDYAINSTAEHYIKEGEEEK